MEYVYAALLIHKAGKAVDEASVKKVMEAAGITADDARIKALIAALEGVNIDEAISKAAVSVAAPVAASAGEAPKAEAKKAEPEEEKVSEQETAQGLGALFG